MFLGTRTCDPVPGGLVLGHVRARNTDEAVNAAAVTSDDDPLVRTRSAATPADPNLDDGLYWMFSPYTGQQRFTASADHYTAHSQQASVGSGKIAERDFRLPTGRLSVEPDTLAAGVRQGRTTKVTFTVTNTGTAPATMQLRERASSYPIPRPHGSAPATAGSGTEVVRIPGEFSPLASGASAAPGDEGAVTQAHGVAPAVAPWIDLPPYPRIVMDNAVGELDGRIFSVGGRDAISTLTQGFVYDPTDRTWSPIPHLPAPRQAAAGAVIDGKFYVAGGWGVGFPEGQGTRDHLRIPPCRGQLDPGRRRAVHLRGRGAGGARRPAVHRRWLHQQLHADPCAPLRPGRRQLGRAPELPGGELAPRLRRHHRAGVQQWGTRAAGVTWNRTYAYDPATDAWTRKADMPIQLWGMSYTASSDRLIVSGGVTGGATDLPVGSPTNPTMLTNEGFVYDPMADTWLSLPASNHHTYRTGNTCGLVKVGGTSVVGFLPVDRVELLPTYGDCVPADVPWLELDTTTATLAPGKKARVTVTLDATVTAPGSHTAGVWIRQDTPYLTYPVDVTMTVTPDGRTDHRHGTPAARCTPGVLVQR